MKYIFMLYNIISQRSHYVFAGNILPLIFNALTFGKKGKVSKSGVTSMLSGFSLFFYHSHRIFL
jgi:hypothetical protein